MSSQFVDLVALTLENFREGLMIIDDKGIVKYFNKALEKISNVKREDIIGKHVKNYSRHTRLHHLLETGKPEIGIKCKYFENIILNRIPLIRDGKIVGAFQLFLFKEAELNNLLKKLKSLESKVDHYQQRLANLLSADYELKDIIGESNNMLAAKDLAQRIAKQDVSVLITGESGTGKEMFAQSIHNLSKRKSGPFVKINCASIPLELIEAELFGYEPGAFTGARGKTKIGKFQMAEGGTLFLDEIGDMHLAMQAKVLRVIQEKEIERLGGEKTHKVDFRIIAATNKDLQKAIQNHEFRADLYYRLNAAPLMLPPLRERGNDIAHLVKFFLLNDSSSNNLRFSSDALACLNAYSWPGNVRELHNAVLFSIGNTNGPVIEKECLPPQLLNLSNSESGRKLSYPSLAELSEKIERDAIKRALDITSGNRSRAAKILNIHRSTLYKKLEKLDLIQ